MSGIEESVSYDVQQDDCPKVKNSVQLIGLDQLNAAPLDDEVLQPAQLSRQSSLSSLTNWNRAQAPVGLTANQDDDDATFDVMYTYNYPPALELGQGPAGSLESGSVHNIAWSSMACTAREDVTKQDTEVQSLDHDMEIISMEYLKDPNRGFNDIETVDLPKQPGSLMNDKREMTSIMGRYDQSSQKKKVFKRSFFALLVLLCIVLGVLFGVGSFQGQANEGTNQQNTASGSVQDVASDGLLSVSSDTENDMNESTETVGDPTSQFRDVSGGIFDLDDTEFPTSSPTEDPTHGPTEFPSSSPSRRPITDTPTSSPTPRPVTPRPSKQPITKAPNKRNRPTPVPSHPPTLSPIRSTRRPTKQPNKRNPGSDEDDEDDEESKRRWQDDFVVRDGEKSNSKQDKKESKRENNN